MTHHKIRVLEDGTRVYSNYTRYKPMADEDRTNKVRKPADPRAVRFHGTWLLPLELQPEEQRVMPETRSDEEAYDHAHKRPRCRCHVCTREGAQRYINKWRKEQGLKIWDR